MLNQLIYHFNTNKLLHRKRSSGASVSIGVPQGSILGPYLFLIYINDLPYMIKDNEIVLFADDTSLVFKLNRRALNFDEINNAIANVVHWFNSNNLLLNERKTKCIRFSLPNVKKTTTDIKIKGQNLDPVESTVFLGVTLDSKLQWDQHIDCLSKKLSSAAFAVKKVRYITDEATSRLVYFSYFHSIMSYGIMLWGSAGEGRLNSIFVLQKRAIRAIYRMSPRESLREKFKVINILTLPCQYIFEVLMYTHKNIMMFPKKSDTHNINTRNRYKLTVPTFRLHKVNVSFKGQCIRLYNKIPKDLQQLSLNKFKRIIKRQLQEKAYYKISDYVQDKNAWNVKL